MASDFCRESQLRSILKAITYRVIGTFATAAMTFAVTGDLSIAVAVGTLEPIVKVGIYYLHERAWQRVPVGTIRRLTMLFRRPTRARSGTG